MAAGRLLVLGAGGQVGRALVEAPPGEVVGVDRGEVDITDADAVARAVSHHRPSVVINAAAYTAVDRAEAERDLALLANRNGAANVARACSRAGVPLIHISTDYVFDGSKPTPYTEEDETNPTCVYGLSKLAGEEAVRETLPDRHLVVRTAWVFSSHGSNFVRTIWRLAQERVTLRIVDDQKGSPTPAAELARDLRRMASALAADTCEAGIYHWAGVPPTTWKGFADAIVEQARRTGRPAVRDVVPISTAEYPTPAQRPANSVLATAKAESAFGLKPPSWREGLTRVADELAAAS